MGILQSYRGRERLAQPLFEVAPLVELIRKHFREPSTSRTSPRWRRSRRGSSSGNSRPRSASGPRSSSSARGSSRPVVRRAGERPECGQIALDHGFCDQSSFTRHFKQHIGQTPTRFRRSSSRHWARPFCIRWRDGEAPKRVNSCNYLYEISYQASPAFYTVWSFLKRTSPSGIAPTAPAGFISLPRDAQVQRTQPRTTERRRREIRGP